MGELIDLIRGELNAAADPNRAPQMQAYMKSAMPYLGVPVPQVRRLTRSAEREHPFMAADEVEAAVRELWFAAAFREERYAATALLDTRSAVPLRSSELLALHHDLIVDGAWWDHVDELAHRAGELLAGWPRPVRPQLVRWGRDEDRWLRRVAIICQLGRKGDTDPALLTEAIEHNAADPDFFIRKAIGWALRDYARTAPDWVATFVSTHQLSALSRREATKRLSVVVPP